MSSERVEEKIPWIPLIALLLVFCFFGPVWVLMLPSGAPAWYSPGRTACHLPLLSGAYLFVILAALIGRIGPMRDRVNAAVLTYLFVVGASAGYVGTFDSFPVVDWYIPLICDRFIDPSSAEKYWPWFFAPRTEIAEQIVHGGVAIPWAEWLPTIVFWGTVYSLFSLLFASVTSILRRGWIEIEKIPFPQGMVGYGIIEALSPGETGSRKLGTPFKVGVVLGIVLQVPLFLQYAFPWFPDIYGWRTNTCLTGAHYISAGHPLGWIAAFGTFQKNPIYAAVFYLAPLSILFSASVFWLMVVILMQIAYTMGYYTGITELDGCGRFWCGDNTFWRGEPFKWLAFTNVGMALGIVLSYVIIYRNYLVETFKAAIGRLPSNYLAKIEENEPMSYRAAYALAALSFILLVVLWMLCDISLPVSVMMVLGVLIFNMATIRVFGLTGLKVPTGGNNAHVLLWAVLPQTPEAVTREWMISTALSKYALGDGLCKGCAHVMFGNFDGWRVASRTGVSSRNVFKVALVSAVIAPFLSQAGFVWACYTFGLARLPTGSPYIYSYTAGWANPQTTMMSPTPPPWWPHALAGIVFTLVLGYLRSRFLWFPLHPLGLLVVTDQWASHTGLWSMFVVAWIAKLLTLRIGGSKAYEEYGVPAVIGFIVGFVIIGLIGGIVLLIRFFIPF